MKYLFVTLCGLIAIGSWIYVLALSPIVYSGHESFTSESQYTQFKQSLVDSHATWDNRQMQVLSSAPPIIVQYSVNVPRQYRFQYGNEDIFVTIFPAIFITIVCFMFGYTASTWN